VKLSNWLASIKVVLLGENAPTYDKLNGLRAIDEVQKDLFAILNNLNCKFERALNRALFI
jgi:hypothetical protein